MPVYANAARVRPPRHDELREELVRHLRGGPGLPKVPKIYEEPILDSPNIAVTVIWSEWRPVTEEERIAIILQAYAQARGERASWAISSAVGLTPREAKEQGISFAV